MDYSTLFMGHVAQMSYNYCQLDIKADGTSLLDAEIYITPGEPLHIEDVADIIIPDDVDPQDRIAIYPRSQDYIPPIVQALHQLHPLVIYTLPEFEEDHRSQDQAPLHYILMTMPPMTKERRDAIQDIVDALHQECKLRIDRTHVEYAAKITLATQSDPHIMQQQLQQLDHSRDSHLDMAQQLTDQVLQDIERAYQKYLADPDTHRSTTTTPTPQDHIDKTKAITF